MHRSADKVNFRGERNKLDRFMSPGTVSHQIGLSILFVDHFSEAHECVLCVLYALCPLQFNGETERLLAAAPRLFELSA
jgi:hypothetical protein